MWYDLDVAMREGETCGHKYWRNGMLEIRALEEQDDGPTFEAATIFISTAEQSHPL